MRIVRPLLGAFVAALIVGGCGDEPLTPDAHPSAPAALPSFDISDGAHQGNEHFYFLPPLVPEPMPSGEFDGSLAPVVEICHWTGTGCDVPLLSVFTTETGPGSETVRVVPEDEQYIVNWYTDQFELTLGEIYRIFVRVGLLDLGYADLIVGTGSMKNVNTDELVPLKDGRTLPIKFRIEEGLSHETPERLAPFDRESLAPDEDGVPTVADQLLVGFVDQVTEGQALGIVRAVGAMSIGWLAGPPVTLQMSVPGLRSLAELESIAAGLNEHPSVVGAALRRFVFVLAGLDNDELAPGDRWAYDAIGLSKAWAAIGTHVPARSVQVAVFDDGIVASNSEFEGVASLSGFTWCGVADWSAPGSLHGTNVAGIIVANNGDGGVNGVLGPRTSYVNLVAHKVSEGGEVCSGLAKKADPYALIAAMSKAARDGTDIVNMSIYPDTSIDPETGSLIRAQLGKEAAPLYVASTGNDGEDRPQWGISEPNFLEVAGIDRSLQRAADTPTKRWTCKPGLTQCRSSGEDGMLSAPAVDVATVSSDATPVLFGGTSAAAPLVTGVAALLKMFSPAALSPREIADMLRSTSTSVTLAPEGWNWQVVNACKAVAAANSSITCGSGAWSALDTGRPFTGVWGTSPSDVFAVGAAPDGIWHFDGQTWETMPPGPSMIPSQMNGWRVWGTSPQDVYAVGSHILHYDGASWSSLRGAPLGGSFMDVWGSSANDVYVVGYPAGVVFHWDGTEWTTVSKGSSNLLRGVAGTSADEVYLVGPYGNVYRGNASTGFVEDARFTAPDDLLEVWGAPSGEVFVVGSASDGAAIWRLEGDAWTREPSGIGPGGWLIDIWGTSATDVWAVGSDATGAGVVLHRGTEGWTRCEVVEPLGSCGFDTGVASEPPRLYGVWSHPDAAFAVGTNLTGADGSILKGSR